MNDRDYEKLTKVMVIGSLLLFILLIIFYITLFFDCTFGLETSFADTYYETYSFDYNNIYELNANDMIEQSIIYCYKDEDL